VRSLDRLRRRVTAWYVGTFGAILLAFGLGLFVAIQHNIEVKLDRSLVRAGNELQRTVTTGTGAAGGDAGIAGARGLRIPDRMLYLFDARGHPVYPDTASAVVRRAAATAIRTGAASLQADIGHEHTLLVHASRFVTAPGDTLIAAAAADTEEVEDEFATLITLFTVSLAVALAFVGLGGYVLARRATEPVEASIEQMRRFMADAAHELRTPVSYVRAHTDVTLQQPRAACEYVAALREIGGEADRLGAIVNDLFTIARAEAGERRIERTLFYLDDVVLEVASEARTVATLAGVHLDITDFEEARVDGDPALVRQLVRIVLDNAIKYTPRGGRVSVAVSVNAGSARVVLEDSGIGIAPADLPRIYDRFFRSERAREQADGAGLGLSIAHWIADAHGGDLVVSSRPEQGTRVEIALPCAGARETAASARKPTVTVA
jgi:signal transduction histidine kinase